MCHSGLNERVLLVLRLSHLHGIPNNEPSGCRERQRSGEDAPELGADGQRVLRLLLGRDGQAGATADAREVAVDGVLQV